MPFTHYLVNYEMTQTGFSIIFECPFHLSTRCIAVDIGSYGKDCDTTVFKTIYAMDISSDKCAVITQ
jgi:hypothetical protein